MLSEEQAVAGAYWRVTLPVVAIMLGCMWPPILLLGFQRAFEEPLTYVGIVGGIALSWLAWSILAPRWRLWAYERVADIPRLKQLAAKDRIVWPDGHLLQRTEIVPPSLRRRLAALEAGTDGG